MPTLLACISALMIVAIGAVLIVEILASRRILSTMGARIVQGQVRALETALRTYMAPALDNATYLAARMAREGYDFSDFQRLSDLATGSFAAAPQVDAILIGDADGNGATFVRHPVSGVPMVQRLDLRTRPDLQAVIDGASGPGSGIRWGDLFYSPPTGRTFINVAAPVRRQGRYAGAVVTGISLSALSALARDMSGNEGGITFILHGRDHVLAHPILAGSRMGFSVDSPIPHREEIGDRALVELPRARPAPLIDLPEETGIQFARLDLNGTPHNLFTKTLTATFGAPTLTIASYRRADEADAPMRILIRSGLTGLAILVVAILLSVLLARGLSKPIRRVASAALAIGRAEFDMIDRLPPSRVREINTLALSFNTMVGSLRAFGRYVPYSLVSELIREGRTEAGSEERTLTVMFTDIAGFTSTCENMSAPQVAAFINSHLSLLGACVEATGGTIDKYIGDSLMAFWGAPEQLDNPAEPAARAALMMAERLARDNEERAARGEKPVRTRIGLHTGPLVVGDIGSENRINYTVVGDVVNVAQRLESLGKELQPEAETSILISSETRELLGADFNTTDRGVHALKGKSEGLRVFDLRR